MKKVLFSAVLFLSISLSAQDLPRIVISPESSSIHAQEGSQRLIRFTVTIPRQGYMYANPKGPGTGKPLNLSVKAKLPHGNILADIPVKYTADPSDGFVWIYRNRLDLYIPYTIRTNETVTLYAEGLYCETSGRCIPFTANASIDISVTAPFTPVTDIKDKKFFLHGDPSLAAVDIASNKYNPFAVMIPSSGTDLAAIPAADGNKKTQSYSFPAFSPEFISDQVTGIFTALLLGLLAGLILNLMPCVLPVLSLKISSLVQNSSNPSQARRNGFMYCAGIFVSFMILAGLASFAGYSWGSLFQRREFIVFMILFLFIMALSMLGVFTLNIPGFASKAAASAKHSAADSFIKGLIASLLATPCSGPLLGATLAWTLTQLVIIIFTVFAAIGLGMALPFLILSIKPSLAGFIPRPGKWTLWFERIMGILLLGSAVYFILILGDESFAAVVLMLNSALIAAMILGRFGSPVKPKICRISARFAFILFIIIGVALFTLFSPKSKSLTGETFSFADIQRNSESGIITVVNFTADWCPNCKIVERAVLHDDEIARLIKNSHAVLAIADITDQGTEAEALLHALGSRSIPFLAVFPAGEKQFQPVCLRDIYSKSDFKKALKRAQIKGENK